jgi:hypothetical protein
MTGLVTEYAIGSCGARLVQIAVVQLGYPSSRIGCCWTNSLEFILGCMCETWQEIGKSEVKVHCGNFWSQNQPRTFTMNFHIRLVE